MDNRAILPIVHQPPGLNSDLSLIEDEDPTSGHGEDRPSQKSKVTKRMVIQPYSQTWVEVTTKNKGLILFDPDPKLFTN